MSLFFDSSRSLFSESFRSALLVPLPFKLKTWVPPAVPEGSGFSSVRGGTWAHVTFPGFLTLVCAGCLR
jgi:hypothetical protein